MDKYTKQNGKIVVINTDANNKMKRETRSEYQSIEALTIKEGEDCAFGSLDWFFGKTTQRQKKFSKY